MWCPGCNKAVKKSKANLCYPVAFYIDKSGDRSYAVGQRLVVRDGDMFEFVDVIEKLAAGLRGAVARR